MRPELHRFLYVKDHTPLSVLWKNGNLWVYDDEAGRYIADAIGVGFIDFKWAMNALEKKEFKSVEEAVEALLHNCPGAYTLRLG